MQISKIFLTVCSAALFLTPFCQAAQRDNEAQSKAREALEQKLKELDSSQTPSAKPEPPAEQPKPATVKPTPPPATNPPAALNPKPEPAQVSKPQPPPVQVTKPRPVSPPVSGSLYSPPPVVVRTPRVSPEEDERAREALRKKMEELNNQQAPTVAAPSAPVFKSPRTTSPEVKTAPPVAPPVAAAPAAAPAVAAQPPQERSDSAFAENPQVPVVVKGPRANPADIERARQALHEKMGALPAEPVEPESQTSIPEIANKRKKHEATPLSFTPIPGPETGLTAEKESRLNALLQKYRADEISPEQYHAERAKILAGQ